MKENVFDVLMYLFENYIYDDEPQPDRESLESELFEAGFHQLEIRKAFTWLDDLDRTRELPAAGIDSSQAIRVFTEDEQAKIDPDTQGFLLYLEQAGVITATSREVIVDRLMALDDEEIDPDLVRWVTLMVLYNQPGQEEAYAWMENLLFDTPVHLVH